MFHFFVILFIDLKRITCFLISRRNKSFDFSINFLLLNARFFERFFEALRRVIEKKNLNRTKIKFFFE